jgi:SAM-dependent MidA family methyltransferase
MPKLAEKIAKEIAFQGPMPFARFMDLALYCPVYGYYEKEADNLGRGGDYFTSVSIGGLFGQLLACQFAEWLSECGARSAEHGTGSKEAGLRVVEAGAHRGDLARDILLWMREHRPDLFPRLEYWIVEPSEHRRNWQRQNLAEFTAKVHWANGFAELVQPPQATLNPQPSRGVHGIIFSNELLDAMPVHRLGWDAKGKTWFEWGVALDGGKFVWTRLPDALSSSHVPPFTFHGSLLDVLPDGFSIEVCPAAEAWWRQAAAVLASGKLLTVDYGLKAEEFFRPERKEGTLRAYREHQTTSDVLAQPGSQDITAHVNFTAIQQAGESAGLRTETITQQERFLTTIAARTWNGDLAFGPWTQAHTRQFQTLTHPDHLGRSFRVLVQSR